MAIEIVVGYTLHTIECIYLFDNIVKWLELEACDVDHVPWSSIQLHIIYICLAF